MTLTKIVFLGIALLCQFFDILFIHKTILGLPKLQPIFLPEFVSAGEKVVATCAVKSGVRPLKFKWEKDGSNIEDIPNSFVDVQSDYAVMTIGPATKANVGNYTCIVENAVGKDSYTVSLILKCKYYTIMLFLTA